MLLGELRYVRDYYLSSQLRHHFRFVVSF